MKFVNCLSIAVAAVSLAASAYAAPTTHKMAHKATAKAIKLICPITGEKISSIADSAGHSTYKGKTYYFCCASCKPMFDKNPTKYAK